MVREPESGELLVNFDPQVTELIKESVYMKKMGLEIPEDAKSLILLQTSIEQSTVDIKELLERYNNFIRKFPKDLLPLMKPHKEVVDVAIKPGLVSVTWASTNIDDYLANIKREMDAFENLGNLAKDILECRVETALQEIANTSLCLMPGEPCSIEEFSKLAEETAQKAVVLLTKYIRFCEAALLDILETLNKHLGEADRRLVRGTADEYYECAMKNEGKGKAQRCQECLGCIYFNFLTLYTQRNNDALVQCTKNSLDSIKKRLQQTNKYLGGQVIREKVKNPLLRADIILAIPNIAAKPTLDDMQVGEITFIGRKNNHAMY